MIPPTDDLQGTWVSRNFQMYDYGDKFEFTYHLGKYATLYFSDGGNNNPYSADLQSVPTKYRKPIISML